MAKVFLVHGWSVTETTTYQALHLQLSDNGFNLQDVNLGRYVSLEDKIEIRDLAKAMHNALNEKLNGDWTQDFHIITHSTGALITKHWITNHYIDQFSQSCALKNVVFLAGPHFGSRLAHHGRSMLAQIRHLGETGEEILKALELGSEFSWSAADAWLDEENWKAKGVRPFNLIGDKVEKNIFSSMVFPAAFEEGSDMVVRVPTGNLNFRRYELRAATSEFSEIGRVENIPFGAMENYTHSGVGSGIMNSIQKASSSAEHESLRIILECLNVTNDTEYGELRDSLNQITTQTRSKRKGFSQLDFRFRDEDGQPVDDYVFKLGAVKNGRKVPSKTVAHTHKNKFNPNHFTVFIKMKELEPNLVYFMAFDAKTVSKLFSYNPDPFEIEAPANTITQIITENQTTQIDVVLSREPNRNLFVFHSGDDGDLHVRWGREGEIKRKKLKVK